MPRVTVVELVWRHVVEDTLMSSDEVEGLTVRSCDGCTVGVVVGVFATGALGGRLRVHGDYAPGRYLAGPQAGTAVFAIPRRAVKHREQDSLVLAATGRCARNRWLMHIRRNQ